MDKSKEIKDKLIPKINENVKINENNKNTIYGLKRIVKNNKL